MESQKKGAEVEQPITIRDTGVRITDVLDMIARGFSYHQILVTHPRLTMADIMTAAKVAKELVEEMVTPAQTISVEGSIEVVASGGKIRNLSRMRDDHPRAFERWSRGEEEQLAKLFHSGKSLGEMATVLERKRGAIKLRLAKLGLVRGPEKKE